MKHTFSDMKNRKKSFDKTDKINYQVIDTELTKILDSLRLIKRKLQTDHK